MTAIIVTGPARSGLAIAAGVVHLCGAWGGKVYKPSWRYSFENAEIRGRLVKPLLHGLGADAECQNPLPDAYNVARVAVAVGARWRSSVLDIIERQGRRDDCPWFYKGADALVLWPVWHAAFPNAHWVLVRRDANAIVRSCTMTKYMRGYTSPEGWAEWLKYHDHARAALAKVVNRNQLHELWPHKLIDGDVSEAKGVVRALGLSWHADDVANFLAPPMFKRGVYLLRG